MVVCYKNYNDLNIKRYVYHQFNIERTFNFINFGGSQIDRFCQFNIVHGLN